MRYLTLLAVSAGVVAAVPAPGWGIWPASSTPVASKTSPPPTVTITASSETPKPTVSTMKAKSSSWGLASSKSQLASASSKIASAWAHSDSISTASKKWGGWNTNSFPSLNADSGGATQWGSLSDPYNLWADDSTSGDGNSASQTSDDRSDEGVDSSPLDKWFRQSLAADPAVPTATLLPGVHWSQNRAHLDYLKPQDSAVQYYKPDGASADVLHQFGWVTTNFTGNTIMLDHSSLIEYTYTVSTGALTVKFSSNRAFSLAQSTWHTGLILAFYDGTCGTAMNCYLVCQQLSFDSDSETCITSTIKASFEDVASYFTFQWGHYEPDRKRGGRSDLSQSLASSSTATFTTTRGSSSYPSQSQTNSGVVSSATTTFPITSSTVSSNITTFSPTVNSGTTSFTSNTSTITSTSSNATTTVAPGNYTIGNEIDNDDCTAPPDTTYGLPTACLGQFFDEDLDDFYGYVDLDQTDFADAVATFPHLWYDDVKDNDLDSTDYAEDDAALNLTKRGLGKRDFSLNPFTIIKQVKQAALSILPPITGITRPYEVPLIQYPFAFNVPTGKTTVSSPWGQQILLKSFQKDTKKVAGIAGQYVAPFISSRLNIYCVDCGASGTAKLAGVVGISAANGIDYVRTNLDMNMAIGLKIGIDASYEESHNFYEPLFVVPLSPLTIGIAVIGPYLKAGVELNLNLKATGKILGGGTMSFNAAKVSLDITSGSGSASGWSPSFDPVFEADGNIAAQADFGVPVALALGIDILKGKFSANAEIVERPGIVAKAQASASANLNGANFVEVNGCQGISADLGYKNDVYAQFVAGSLANKRFNLFNQPNKQLASTCITLKSTATTLTAKSTTTSAEEPAATTTTYDVATTTTNEAQSTTTTGELEATTTTTEAATTTPEEGKVTATVEKRRSLVTEYPRPHESTNVERLSRVRFFKRQDNSTTDNSTTTDVTAETIASNGTENDTPYVVPDSNEHNYTRTDGYMFSSLVDSTVNYQAYPCSNGNIQIFAINDTILASDCQEDFTMFEDDDSGLLVIADGFTRIFVYYPDEMNKTGVSRIRVVDVANIPRGAEELIWFPDQTNITVDNPVYYPVNQNQDVFYSAMCKYTNSSLYNKLFIMSDPVAGLTTLQDPALKYSITGGNIDSCYFIPLINGGAYDTEEGTNGGFFTDVPGDDGDDDSVSTTTTVDSTAAATATSSTTSSTGKS